MMHGSQIVLGLVCTEREALLILGFAGLALSSQLMGGSMFKVGAPPKLRNRWRKMGNSLLLL